MVFMEKILFIDTLTTGMNPEHCAIYRMAGIYTEDGTEVSRFELKVRPFRGARLSDQSLWIGGTDRMELTRYPDDATAFQDFIKYLDGIVDVRNAKDKLYIAGFNAATFDVPFIREWFLRNGNSHFRDYFFMQIIDLMTVAAFVMGPERRAMRDFKLESVANALQVPVYYSEGCDCLRNAKVSLDIYRNLKGSLGLDEYTETAESETVYRNF